MLKLQVLSFTFTEPAAGEDQNYASRSFYTKVLINSLLHLLSCFLQYKTKLPAQLGLPVHFETSFPTEIYIFWLIHLLIVHQSTVVWSVFPKGVSKVKTMLFKSNNMFLQYWFCCRMKSISFFYLGPYKKSIWTEVCRRNQIHVIRIYIK